MQAQELNCRTTNIDCPNAPRSLEEIWQARCSAAIIATDLSQGCKCALSCCANLLTVASVVVGVMCVVFFQKITDVDLEFFAVSTKSLTYICIFALSMYLFYSPVETIIAYVVVKNERLSLKKSWLRGFPRYD